MEEEARIVIDGRGWRSSFLRVEILLTLARDRVRGAGAEILAADPGIEKALREYCDTYCYKLLSCETAPDGLVRAVIAPGVFADMRGPDLLRQMPKVFRALLLAGNREIEFIADPGAEAELRQFCSGFSYGLVSRETGADGVLRVVVKKVRHPWVRGEDGKNRHVLPRGSEEWLRSKTV